MKKTICFALVTYFLQLSYAVDLNPNFHESNNIINSDHAVYLINKSKEKSVAVNMFINGFPILLKLLPEEMFIFAKKTGEIKRQIPVKVEVEGEVFNKSIVQLNFEPFDNKINIAQLNGEQYLNGGPKKSIKNEDDKFIVMIENISIVIQGYTWIND